MRNHEDIPVIMEAPGTVMRKLSGLGNMDVNFHELPEEQLLQVEQL